MDAGTAKPSQEELMEVKHHLINSLSIHDDYNAGRFEADAIKIISELFRHKDMVILCGGSGLYIDLVCHGSDELPVRNETLRNELADLLAKEGLEALQHMLKELDPDYYEIVDRRNPQRLMRAIEVCRESGKKYSELRTNKKITRPFEVIWIGLDDERETIYQRIDGRVDEMMKNGLLEEAGSLRTFRHLNALQTVGYSEMFEFLEGKISLEEAISRIKQHTRNYAKRQLTWFRKNKQLTWFRKEEVDKIINHINFVATG